MEQPLYLPPGFCPLFIIHHSPPPLHTTDMTRIILPLWQKVTQKPKQAEAGLMNGGRGRSLSGTDPAPDLAWETDDPS